MEHEQGLETGAGERKAFEREQFFQQLTDFEFDAEETALKGSVRQALEDKGGSCRLNLIAADGRVRQAKAAILPKGVSISMWIQRRMSEELVIEPDPLAKDNQLLKFADASLIQPAVAQEHQPTVTKGKSGRSALSGKGKASGFSMWSQSGNGKGSYLDQYGHTGAFSTSKGMFWPPGQWGYELASWSGTKGKGKGKDKDKGKGKHVKGEEVISSKGKGKHVKGEDVDNGKGKSQGKRDAFFESLPQTELTIEETVLANALLEKLSNVGGSSRLNFLVADPTINQAKQALLPKGVGIVQWIHSRVATTFSVEPDPVALNNQIVSIVQSGHQAKKRAEQLAFLEQLPDGQFSDKEATFLDAIVVKLQSMGGSARLNLIIADPTVNQAKTAFLPKGIGVAYWIEQRVRENLTLDPDPVAQNNQILSIANSASDEQPAKRRRLHSA